MNENRSLIGASFASGSGIAPACARLGSRLVLFSEINFSG